MLLEKVAQRDVMTGIIQRMYLIMYSEYSRNWLSSLIIYIIEY
jgi:hypothetical protein